MWLIGQNSHAIELRRVSEFTNNAEANANIKLTRRYVKIRSFFFFFFQSAIDAPRLEPH